MPSNNNRLINLIEENEVYSFLVTGVSFIIMGSFIGLTELYKDSGRTQDVMSYLFIVGVFMSLTGLVMNRLKAKSDNVNLTRSKKSSNFLLYLAAFFIPAKD